jgi:phosphoribosyl-dephospho-CoA transferase
MRPEQLPADAPAWAVAVLAAGQPVVVRRAVVAPGQVAVGLRGATRDQRLAALMPIAAISHRLTPEQLRLVERVYLDFVRAGARLQGEDRRRY